jgi:hypothetical protein
MAYTIDSIDSQFGSGGSLLSEQATGGLKSILSQMRTAVLALDVRLTHLEWAAITTTSTTTSTSSTTTSSSTTSSTSS